MLHSKKGDRRYKTYRSNPAAARRRARDARLMAGDDFVDRGEQIADDAPVRTRSRRATTPRSNPVGARRATVRRVCLVLGLLLLALVVGFGVWGYLGYRKLDDAVAKANSRIDADTEAALTPDNGSIFTTPTTILILGVDKRGTDPGRSDSIILWRSHPATKTFSQLSIARDMWVDIPGHGMGKINTAYFWGGLPLAVKTVEGFTGIPINHVVLMKLNSFPRLIDAVGGVDVNVPKTISSWYSGGTTVTFKKGLNHMDGKRAMIYSRIRKVDDDFHRQARQQQVMQALQKKLMSASSFWHFSSVGSEAIRALSTDLTTWELSQLAWRKWRAKGTWRGIMKGTAGWQSGQSVVISDKQANLRLIDRFLGD